MANTSSAKKAARQMVSRTEVNKSRRSRYKSTVSKVETALASGDAANAAIVLQAAESKIMRAANQGTVHKKAAARKVSRLNARLKKMSASA